MKILKKQDKNKEKSYETIGHCLYYKNGYCFTIELIKILKNNNIKADIRHKEIFKIKKR